MLTAPAQNLLEGKYYGTSHGRTIYMPLGEMSFANRVVSFDMGEPAPAKKFRDPQQALGEPNYTRYRIPNYVSLGCGGSIVLEFTDNGFINMEGADLFVWEVGPSKEPYELEISTDGKQWRSLGIIPGGDEKIDIAPVVSDSLAEPEIFYFVRITDQETICTGDTIGSDIDAVGTISGVIKIELGADVLFDFDQDVIKPEAKDVIIELANKIAQVGVAKIRVEGHTDSDGSAAYNIGLSQRRADAVLQKIQGLLEDRGEYAYKTLAHGEEKPITTNETAAGRQQNRRVEIIVLPHKDFYKDKRKQGRR